MSQTAGMATALELLKAAGVDLSGFGVGDDENQPELFGETDDAPRPVRPAKGRSGPQGGRPKGARNRSTAETRAWLLSRGVAPLAALQDLVALPFQDLHDQLQAQANKHQIVNYSETGITTKGVQISPLDVIRLQIAAATTLAEYTDQKQPKAVEVTSGDGKALVIIGDFGNGDYADGLALPLTAETVEYQDVTDGKALQSDDD